jgi:hypothetical protein
LLMWIISQALPLWVSYSVYWHNLQILDWPGKVCRGQTFKSIKRSTLFSRKLVFNSDLSVSFTGLDTLAYYGIITKT